MQKNGIFPPETTNNSCESANSVLKRVNSKVNLARQPLVGPCECLLKTLGQSSFLEQDKYFNSNVDASLRISTNNVFLYQKTKQYLEKRTRNLAYFKKLKKYNIDHAALTFQSYHTDMFSMKITHGLSTFYIDIGFRFNSLFSTCKCTLFHNNNMCCIHFEYLVQHNKYLLDKYSHYFYHRFFTKDNEASPHLEPNNEHENQYSVYNPSTPTAMKADCSGEILFTSVPDTPQADITALPITTPQTFEENSRYSHLSTPRATPKSQSRKRKFSPPPKKQIWSNESETYSSNKFESDFEMEFVSCPKPAAMEFVSDPKPADMDETLTASPCEDYVQIKKSEYQELTRLAQLAKKYLNPNIITNKSD